MGRIFLTFTFLILFTSNLYAQSNHNELILTYLKTTKVDKILHNDTFIIGYSYKYKQPIWTYTKVTAKDLKVKSNRKKLCKFKIDKRIPEIYRSTKTDYVNSGFDRGHISGYSTVDFTDTGAKQSCYLSNISPQYGSGFNRSKWKLIEEETRKIIKELGSGCIITVVFFDNNPFNDRYMSTGQKLQIPDAFAKIILINNLVHKVYFLEHKEYK